MRIDDKICVRGSMDRASDSGSEGWGFESLPACQLVASDRPLAASFSFHCERIARPFCCAPLPGPAAGAPPCGRQLPRLRNLDFHRLLHVGASDVLCAPGAPPGSCRAGGKGRRTARAGAADGEFSAVDKWNRL